MKVCDAPKCNLIAASYSVMIFDEDELAVAVGRVDLCAKHLDTVLLSPKGQLIKWDKDDEGFTRPPQD